MYTRHPHKSLRCLLTAFGLGAALAGLAHADPPSALGPLPGEMMANPASPTGLLDRPYLTGDPGGYRSNLAKQGVTFDLEYLNDYFGIVQGDHPRGHDDDWGRVRLTIDVDFGKLLGVNGLSFHFSGLNAERRQRGGKHRQQSQPQQPRQCRNHAGRYVLAATKTLSRRARRAGRATCAAG